MKVFVIISLIFAISQALCADVKTIGKVGQKTFVTQAKDEAKQWPAAKTFCQNNGMKLATIESTAENNFVKSFLLKTAQSGANVHHGWIGATKESGNWKSLATERPLIYTNWGEGEPTDGSYDKCIYMGPSGSWDATYCELAAKPICSK